MSRTAFVLVHGSWLGGWIWSPVLERLWAAGHRAFAPTLTGLGERAHLISPEVGLDTHIQDIVGLIEAEELDDIVLVGHSFSGIAITGAADRLRPTRRLRRLVYFDAIIPGPGRMSGAPRDPATGALTEWFTTRQAGFIDGYKMDFFRDYPIRMLANDDEPEVQALARRRITPHPMRGWTDLLTLENGGGDGLPRTLIYCAGQQFAPSSDAMVGPARNNPDWQWIDLPVSRLGMLSQPDLVARTLLALG